MKISRRRLIALGATGAAGTIAGGMTITEASASATGDRLPGIHVSVLTKGVGEDAFKGYAYHFTMTVHGPDPALNGMGWGGSTDAEALEELPNARCLQSVYSLAGAVDGDVVRLHGLVLYSPDKGQEGFPLSFEANLATGFVRYRSPDFDLTFEGTGVVSRI